MARLVLRQQIGLALPVAILFSVRSHLPVAVLAHQTPVTEHWPVARVARAVVGFSAALAAQETHRQRHQVKAVMEALLLPLRQMKAQVVVAVLQRLALPEHPQRVVTAEMERHHPFLAAALLIVAVEQGVLITEERRELVGLAVVEMQALRLLQIP